MEVKMRKKGFMFTLVAIFLISIFIFILFASSSHVFVAQQQLEAERTEAIVMNMFMTSFRDHHLDSFVRVSGRNALTAMVAYVDAGYADSDGGISEYEDFAHRVFMNGTVPMSYDMTSASYDFDMTLLARNGTQEITITSMEETGTTIGFGGTTALAQYVVGDSDDPIDTLTEMRLVVTNTSSDSGDIYLLVYDADYMFLALDHVTFDDADGDAIEYMNFTFGQDLPFDGDHGYYLVLVAPYVSSGDFEVVYTTGSDVEEWTIREDTSGTTAHVPIDFYLDEAILREGFLLGLLNNYARFGLENMNILAHMNITDVLITDKDPWRITANATVIFSATKDTVSYSNVVLTAEEAVPVVGLTDPYNLLQDEWGASITVANQSLSEGDIDAFYSHVADQTFVFNENAPSFLQRFSGDGDLSSSCCGIQTVLNTDDVSSVADEDRGYSFVDHEFQESTECDADSSLYVYYISSDPGTPESWDSSLYGTSGPHYEWEDVEFYGMDSMQDDGYLTLVADCPASS